MQRREAEKDRQGGGGGEGAGRIGKDHPGTRALRMKRWSKKLCQPRSSPVNSHDFPAILYGRRQARLAQRSQRPFLRSFGSGGCVRCQMSLSARQPGRQCSKHFYASYHILDTRTDRMLSMLSTRAAVGGPNKGGGSGVGTGRVVFGGLRLPSCL